MYTTRFAPTPSGPLHFGSLVTLTASYLRARSLQGRFLLRIEDLDTPRCHPEMSQRIVQEIASLGFDHDGDILYQSQNLARYEQRLHELVQHNQIFYCSCTREQLKSRPCTCRFNKQNIEKSSIRFVNDTYVLKGFNDNLLGYISFDAHEFFGERNGEHYGEQYMILKRRDGIFSYNFACVIDDIDSKISEIVRGGDLINVSVPQLALFDAFNAPHPQFLHLPLALEPSGRKLSKQNHAPAILEMMSAPEALKHALHFLGQDTEYISNHMNCHDILHEAVKRFSLQKIPHHSFVPQFSCSSSVDYS